MICKNLLQFARLSFTLVDFLCCAESFWFDVVPSLLLLLFSLPEVTYPEKYC